MNNPHPQNSFYQISRKLKYLPKYKELSIEARYILLELLDFAWTNKRFVDYNMALRIEGRGPMRRQEMYDLIDPVDYCFREFCDALAELIKSEFLTKKLIHKKTYYLIINVPSVVKKEKVKNDKGIPAYISAEDVKNKLIKIGINAWFFNDKNLWQPENDKLLEKYYVKIRELLVQEGIDVVKVFVKWAKEETNNKTVKMVEKYMPDNNEKSNLTYLNKSYDEYKEMLNNDS